MRNNNRILKRRVGLKGSEESRDNNGTVARIENAGIRAIVEILPAGRSTKYRNPRGNMWGRITRKIRRRRKRKSIKGGAVNINAITAPTTNDEIFVNNIQVGYCGKFDVEINPSIDRGNVRSERIGRIERGEENLRSPFRSISREFLGHGRRNEYTGIPIGMGKSERLDQ